jgi:hypothetical protein
MRQHAGVIATIGGSVGDVATALDEVVGCGDVLDGTADAPATADGFVFTSPLLEAP